VKVLGRLDDDVIHAHRRQASEKRQGTKSREIGRPTLQERLWGFRRVDVVPDRGQWAV
jgi:hypothetical protein